MTIISALWRHNLIIAKLQRHTEEALDKNNYGGLGVATLGGLACKQVDKASRLENWIVHVCPGRLHVCMPIKHFTMMVAHGTRRRTALADH